MTNSVQIKRNKKLFSQPPAPDEIADRRQRLGYSHEDISKLFCVSIAVVKAWEEGTELMPVFLWLGLKVAADGIACDEDAVWKGWSIRDDRLCDPHSQETFSPGDLRGMFYTQQIISGLESENRKLRSRVEAQKEREAAHWDTRDFMLGRFCSTIALLSGLSDDLKNNPDPLLKEIGQPFTELTEKMLRLMVRMPTDLDLNDDAEPIPPGSERIQ